MDDSPKNMADNPDGKNCVNIMTFSTDWEAHIAQGVLAENDIPSFLNNEIFSSIYPLGFNTLGGIPLYVRSQDAEKALELLKNAEA